MLLAGDSLIAIDNCERALGGEFLCQILTQSVVRTRILGESRAPEISTGAFVAATGNNLVLVGDLTRRALLCRLDPKVERPETRVFDWEPIAVAKSNRAKYVGAALTILRAFHVAGRPGAPSPLGSFEAWSDLVCGALLWLGCANPIESMDELRRADPRLDDLTAVIAQWRNAIGRRTRNRRRSHRAGDRDAIEWLRRKQTGIRKARLPRSVARHRGAWRGGQQPKTGKMAGGKTKRWPRSAAAGGFDLSEWRQVASLFSSSSSVWPCAMTLAS